MKAGYPVVVLKEDRRSETHYYLREDTNRVVPGVSEIKTQMGLQDLNKIPVSVLVNARNRGIAVHDVCEKWELGTLREELVHPEVVPYLTAFKAWHSEYHPTLVFSEKVVYSQTHNFAGKLDRVYDLHGNIIVDLKTTSAVDKAYGLQTMFYALATEEQEDIKIKGRMIVQLKKDATFKVYDCENPACKLYDPLSKEKVINLAKRYNARILEGNIDPILREVYSY